VEGFFGLMGAFVLSLVALPPVLFLLGFTSISEN